MPDFNSIVTAVIAILMSTGFAAAVSKWLEMVPGWHDRSSFFKYSIATLLTSLASIAAYFLMSSPLVLALPANNPVLAGLLAAIGWFFVQWYHEKYKDTPSAG